MQAAAWQLPWGLRNWPRPPISESDTTGRDFWTIIQENRPEGRGISLFANAISTQMQSIYGANTKHIIITFNWVSLREVVVINVGSSNGHISVPIAREFPQLSFVVQDLAKNEGSANELIKAAGLDQGGRVQFQRHDFFAPQLEAESVPKAYFLSRVLHDWPDEDCVRILTQLLHGLKHGAKLFLVERVVPSRPEEVPLHQEAQHRVHDLIMYSLLGGCERSRDDWQRLLHAVDEKLELRTITAMPGSEFSVIVIDN